MISEVTYWMMEMLFGEGLGIFTAGEYIVSMLPFLTCTFIAGGTAGVVLMSALALGKRADRLMDDE